MGPKVPPVLEDRDDLKALAETSTAADTSEANGSSIVLLAEYADRAVVLAGDAFPVDVLAGLEAARGGQAKLDAFKLPHHGSQSNVVKRLVEGVDCDCWLFSTDGTRFRHPDPIALARVISYSSVRPPRVGFNVPSKFNGWWNNDDWRDMFGYKTLYGTAEDGLTLTFG